MGERLTYFLFTKGKVKEKRTDAKGKKKGLDRGKRLKVNKNQKKQKRKRLGNSLFLRVTCYEEHATQRIIGWE